MIPVYLQQFKAAGVYRVVFDQSTVLNVDSQILRLVVGYSEKGPFNIPVYVTNATDFRTYFGDISKKLEKRGVFFHRLALQALQAGPILCLNLKKFENDCILMLQLLPLIIELNDFIINIQSLEMLSLWNPLVCDIQHIKVKISRLQTM